jgi:predicted TIM-barrel fold metal-dependent hydrolase
MIIDSHAHAWSTWPYEPAVPDAASRGRVEQLLWEMDRNGVDRAVLVAARIDHNPDNNDYVAAAVAAHPDRLIQFADVDCKWTADYHRPGAAERLHRAAERYRLTGFTHYLDSVNDGWLVSDEGMAFFAAAAARGLVASIAGSPVWQADLRTVARAFPALTVLCHHLAGIPSYAGDKQAGLDMVLASAEVPNIHIKASGFYYGAAAPWDYPAYPSVGWFETLYRAFGARRLCWGSDFPVAPMRACTYRQSLEILRTHCAFVSPDDLDWILGRSLEAILAGRGEP